MKTLHTILVYIIIAPIYLYKLTLSPFIGRHCCFYPTCSTYTILAIKKYGILKGIKMGFVRICKCNPMKKEFTHDEP
ncbi:MAG: membrane protein insertion efficiency factor YidD [Proteobacteria bacterium]|nr:membrane protein insertion efficiency factor YidD [Pseudomonadota bacterium]